MAFPATRHTLIQRIVATGDGQDWRVFFHDYWGPICRFAMHQGGLTLEEAEDVASISFEAIWRNQLLARWVAQPSAKLRTLCCSVVKNVLANRGRVLQGRNRRLREHGGKLDDRGAFPLLKSPDEVSQHADAFYAAWAEQLLQHATEALMVEYHRLGRGNCFRVLYGRLCDQMNLREIADALGITHDQAENFFRHARERLTSTLERLVREHVARYSNAEDIEVEFEQEWRALGSYLNQRGGLADAVAAAYRTVPQDQIERMSGAMNSVVARIMNEST